MRGININAYFANIRIGDSVWDFIFNWGIVQSIDIKRHNAIKVAFKMGGIEQYDFQGRLYPNANQSLFWDQVLFEKPIYTKINFILKTLNEILGIPKELNVALPDGDIIIDKDVIPVKLREYLGKKVSGLKRTDKDGSIFYETDGMRVKNEWVKISVKPYTIYKEPRMVGYPPDVGQIGVSGKIDRTIRGRLSDKQVQEIRALRGKKTHKEIAEIYGIATRAIGCIQLGDAYRNVLNSDGTPYIPPSLRRRLTTKEIQEIRALRGKKTQKEIGKMFGVSKSLVESIQLKGSHKDVLNPDRSEYIRPSNRCNTFNYLSTLSRRKLSNEDVQNIREMRKKKCLTDIADAYNIAISTVDKIVRGITYEDILNRDGGKYIPLKTKYIGRDKNILGKSIQDVREREKEMSDKYISAKKLVEGLVEKGQLDSLKVEETIAEFVNSSDGIEKVEELISKLKGNVKKESSKVKQAGKSDKIDRKSHGELSDKEIQEIRALREKKTQKEIAEIYGIGRSTVSPIQLGRIYGDILNPNGFRYIPPLLIEHKFTLKEIQEIRVLRGKKSQEEIAEIYGVTIDCIGFIQRGKTYKNVLNPNGSKYVPPLLRSNLTLKDIQEIRELRRKKTSREIGKIYEIKASAVIQIQLGQTHKNVPNPDRSSYVIPPLLRLPIKLTTKEIQEIRALRGKKTGKEIGNIYKISKSAISRIQLGQIRRDIPDPNGFLYIPPQK